MNVPDGISWQGYCGSAEAGGDSLRYDAKWPGQRNGLDLRKKIQPGLAKDQNARVPSEPIQPIESRYFVSFGQCRVVENHIPEVIHQSVIEKHCLADVNDFRCALA